jgi:hypothetical protein
VKSCPPPWTSVAAWMRRSMILMQISGNQSGRRGQQRHVRGRVRRRSTALPAGSTGKEAEPLREGVGPGSSSAGRLVLENGSSWGRGRAVTKKAATNVPE